MGVYTDLINSTTDSRFYDSGRKENNTENTDGRTFRGSPSLYSVWSATVTELFRIGRRSHLLTHAAPLRRTVNYNENLFARTIDDNPIIDKAYQLVKTA